MEPIYYYIIILSLIAARLLYDATLRKSAANKTLLKMVHLQDEIKELFEKTYSIDYQPHLDLDPNKKSELFAQTNHSYNCLMINARHCKYLNGIFAHECDALPYYLRKKLTLEYLKSGTKWLNEKHLRDYHREFLDGTKKYIAEHYNPTNWSMLEFSREFFAENAVEQIKRPDGSIIDKEKINQDMNKWQLNKKLNEKLPPKAKTKVNKI